MSVRTRFTQLLFAAAAAVAAFGCNSTGVGNPGAELTVTVQNDLQPEPQAADTAQLAPAQVRHVVLAFSELRFIPCDSSVGNVVAPGPFVVDLVTNEVNPEFPSVPLPPGGFCGLDAPLTTLGGDASMFGNSILFSGVRTDGTPFILYAAMPGTLRMRPVAGVAAWDENNASSVIWAIRPLRWLAPQELDAESPQPFGNMQIIVIDMNRHPLLYNVIRSRIGARTTLHTDLNGDHKLDDNERKALIGQGLPSLN